MIDDLTTKMKEQNAAVAYVYFDYKDPEGQTLDKVIRSLLKQLLSSLNLVPRELEALYDESRARSTTPDASALQRHLISAIPAFASVFIMFDALDECSNHNFEEVAGLILQLEKGGAKICCTSRINTWEVRLGLGLPAMVEIKAYDDDV